MMLKIKAFIYRLSSMFGKRIYLAKKEEDAIFANAIFANLVMCIIRGTKSTDIRTMLSVGLWHADNGFTSLYTKGMPRIKAIKQNIIHLFRG